MVDEARLVSGKAAISANFINHGGIVIVARNGIKMTKIDLSHKLVSFEVVCVRLRSGNSTSMSILSVVYRPGSKEPTPKFFSELSQHLESLVMYSCPVYLTGDLNVHVNISNNKHAIKLRELLDMFRLLQHVPLTQETHKDGNTLDLFVCDESLDASDLNITDIGVSDHHLVTCSVNLSSPAPTFITRTSRNWRDFDVDAFRLGVVAALGAHNSASWSNSTLDELVENYDATMTSLLDQLAPSRTKTFRVRPSNLWFDAECRTAKRLTRMLERKYLKTQLLIDLSAWITQLRTYHRLCDSKRHLFWRLKI
jgi:hypothetical protein